jgi:malonyl CoA-acyl carrier protein transacylase
MSIYDTPMIVFKKALAGDITGMKKGLFCTDKKAHNNFVGLFDEADKAFNIAEQYREYLRKRVQASSLYAQAVDGKRWLFTIAKVREAEANAIIGGGTEEEFGKVCARLAKNMGFRVDPSAVTIAEFYSYLLV